MMRLCWELLVQLIRLLMIQSNYECWKFQDCSAFEHLSEGLIYVDIVSTGIQSDGVVLALER